LTVDKSPHHFEGIHLLSLKLLLASDKKYK
jgi:hypothetical protein